MEFAQNPVPTADDLGCLQRLNGVTVLRVFVYGQLFQIKNFQSEKKKEIENLVFKMNSFKIQHENKRFEFENFIGLGKMTEIEKFVHKINYCKAKQEEE